MNQNDNYSKYYMESLEEGIEFQDFVVDLAWNVLGLAIVQYHSKFYQNKNGESKTGVEIKYDKKFKQTGNLWIEIAEKTNPLNNVYIASGINRKDNTWLYCIGDYENIFIFAKSFLKKLAKSGKYKIIENNTKTSKGFLLSLNDAKKYAAAIILSNVENKGTQNETVQTL